MAKRKTLIDRLPAVPCTPDMRRNVQELADDAGRSIADVLRDAVAFYLSSSGTKSITDDSKKRVEVE